MSHLSYTEVLRSVDMFYVSLYGADIYEKWKTLKQEMNFATERHFVRWMLDFIERYSIKRQQQQQQQGYLIGGEMQGGAPGIQAPPTPAAYQQVGGAVPASTATVRVQTEQVVQTETPEPFQHHHAEPQPQPIVQANASTGMGRATRSATAAMVKNEDYNASQQQQQMNFEDEEEDEVEEEVLYSSDVSGLPQTMQTATPVMTQHTEQVAVPNVLQQQQQPQQQQQDTKTKSKKKHKKRKSKKRKRFESSTGESDSSDNEENEQVLESTTVQAPPVTMISTPSLPITQQQPMQQQVLQTMSESITPTSVVTNTTPYTETQAEAGLVPNSFKTPTNVSGIVDINPGANSAPGVLVSGEEIKTPFYQLPTADKPFPCNTCSAAFANRQQLAQHENTVHISGQIYYCKYCDGVYYSKSDRLSHVIDDHQDVVKCHSCELCGQKFTTRSVMLAHQRAVHTQRELMCSFCDKTFNWPQALTLHKKRVHLGMCFKCEVCDKKLSSKQALLNHMQKLHREVDSTGEPVPVPIGEGESVEGVEGCTSTQSMLPPAVGVTMNVNSLPQQLDTGGNMLQPQQQGTVVAATTGPEMNNVSTLEHLDTGGNMLQSQQQGAVVAATTGLEMNNVSTLEVIEASNLQLSNLENLAALPPQTG